MKKKNEADAELRRAIKLSLRFIRDERDWSANSSPKISLRKTEGALGAVGIYLD